MSGPTVSNPKFLWPSKSSKHSPVWPHSSDPDCGVARNPDDEFSLVVAGTEVAKVKVEGAPGIIDEVSKRLASIVDEMVKNTITYGSSAVLSPEEMTIGIDLSDHVSQAKMNLLAGFDPTTDSPAGEAARAAYRTFARILRLKDIESSLAASAELVADTYDK